MYKSALIIDDSNIDRFLTETTIRNNSFAESIVGVGSASEAITYLKSLADFPARPPDLIFLDINMPDMNGFDFLNSFNLFPAELKRHCTIFMVSATESKDDLDRIKDFPVVCGLFEKPLTTDHLREITVYMHPHK